MVIGLAEAMSVPLADRNAMLAAAGFSSQYRQTPINDAAMGNVRAALDLILKRHMPYPALLIDRYWNILDANAGCAAVFGLQPGPRNFLTTIAEHPGLTEKFENWSEIAHHIMVRLQTELTLSGGDEKLADLMRALKESPAFQNLNPPPSAPHPFVATRVRCGDVVLSLLSTIAYFGTATDITVSDLRIELFLPADIETDRAIHDIVSSHSG